MSVLYIALGAVMGAIVRWLIGLYLNPLWGAMSLGVLAVNYLGCFLIGLCLAFNLSEQSKLLLITGFLGSFTTFSAFSADILDKLMNEKYANAMMILLLHSVGGVLLTVLGFLTVRMLRVG